MSTSRRLVGIAALAVTVTAVSGCGNGELFHDSTAAASRNGTSVSIDQVQQAVSQIKQAFGANAASFDSGSAITYLLFADDLQRVAAQGGGAISAGQARAQFAQRNFNNPSTAAVTALRSNVALGSIGNNPQGGAEISRIVKAASVQVNPRFGRWDGVKGVMATPQPWIVATTKSPTS